MIYKHLSLASGGGIFDRRKLSKQTDSANIFIGLGGTGVDCLKEIKKQVYNRIVPDVPEADSPRYDHIQFLAIDSDPCAFRDDGSISALDPATECVDISHQGLMPIVHTPHPAFDWLSDDISVFSAASGAGAVRQVGRALLMLHIGEVYQAIHSKICHALIGLRDTPVNIHIFTGLCGGTGSGIFLDLCYILQEVLRNMAIERRAYTCGYFFLPDVNLVRGEIDSVRDYIEANGFAAMKELDYCMNFEHNGGSWDQNYSTFEIHTTQPPVMMAHLISARDMYGDINPDGYRYAMNVAAEYVIDLTSAQIIDESLPDEHLKVHIANADCIVAIMGKNRGVCYRYFVLGASSAYIPYKDINSYLAARIFEAYAKLPQSCHDIDEFVNTHGLSYKALLNEINKNAGAIPMFEVDPGELYNKELGNHNALPLLLSYMLGKQSKIIGNYAKNRENMVQNTIVSLKNVLVEYAADPSKGPVYAALLLKNHYKPDLDMTVIVEGYLQENERNKSQALATLEPREQELDTAFREFRNSNILNRKKKAQAYTHAANAYVTQQLKIKLYDEMGDFLMAFREQVSRLHHDFFMPLAETMENLADTFRQNLYILNENAVVNSYDVKIGGLDDARIRESLDETVQNLNSPLIIANFVEYMTKQPEVWLNRYNEARLAKYVSEYFVRTLDDVTSKSIDEYLATALNTHSRGELVDAIYQEVLYGLKRRAVPLFWSKWFIGEMDKMDSCYFPGTSAVIEEAVDKLIRANPQLMGTRTVMPDRISLISLICGISICQYKGIDYFRQDDQTAGRYLYEGTERDPRDFRKLFALTPLSMIPDERITPEIQQFMDDYREAQEAGIIFKELRRDPGLGFDYFLRKIDAEHSTKDAVVFGESVLLPNTGEEGYKDNVVCDHVFASPVYTALMREQLELYRQLLQPVQDPTN